MSAMDAFQLMSDVEVKFKRGIFDQTDFGVFCVTFNTPNIALKNLVFMYVKHAIASDFS